MKNENPKVFICHASEDKQRFVLDFAKRLSEKGIDVWLDKWEMKLGESLEEKIFDEGIENCENFIIILSKNSINKKWVTEELSSAFVRRKRDKVKIISIIIDSDIKVPTAINYLHWKKINDLSNYDEEFKEIVMSIYGLSEKPPLGEKPKFSVDMPLLEGFTKTDSIVLKIIGDIILQTNNTIRFLNLRDVIKEAVKHEISKNEIIESVEILNSEGYLDLKGARDSSPLIVEAIGFVEYCKHFLDNFNVIFLDVLSLIINSGLKDSVGISSKIDCELVVVVSLLDYFHDLGYIKVLKAKGMESTIFKIYAEGRRYFKNILEKNR